MRHWKQRLIKHSWINLSKESTKSKRWLQLRLLPRKMLKKVRMMKKSLLKVNQILLTVREKRRKRKESLILKKNVPMKKQEGLRKKLRMLLKKKLIYWKKQWQQMLKSSKRVSEIKNSLWNVLRKKFLINLRSRRNNCWLLQPHQNHQEMMTTKYLEHNLCKMTCSVTK